MTKKSTGRERENPLRAIGDITEHKRAEQALRESEEQWRSLVENIPDIIMTLDRDGTILFINRTPPGFTVEATIGAIVYDYVPPEHHDTLRRSLEGVFETGDGHDYEIVAPGPFGRTSWYFNRIGPIVRDGRVVAAALIATDITERRQAEEALQESEEQFRLVTDAVPVLISYVDSQQRYRFNNTGYEEWFGCPRAEVYGQHVKDVLGDSAYQAIREHIESALSGQEVTFEDQVPYRDGGARHVSATYVPDVSKEGEVRGFVALVSDITERKQAEEELRKRTRDLDERVKELNCFHGISKLVDEPDISLQEIVQGTVDLIPASWQYPEVTCARIILEGQEFSTKNFNEAPWRQTADITVRGQSVGTLDVCYLEERPERDEGPFLKEERSLINAIAGRLGRITDRKQDQEAVSRQAEVNSSIAEISRALIESRPIDDISDVVLECAKGLTSSAFGFVGYIDPQTGYLVSPTLTKDIWDACQVPDKDSIFKEFSGLWGWVLVNRKPLLTNAPADDPRSSGTPPGHVPVHRFLSVPALVGGTLVGQVAVANSDRDYIDHDLVPLERLAVLYALAVERKRAEEALRQSEDRYRTLVEAAPDVIYALSIDGTITSLNSAFESTFGWSRDNWLGKHFAPIIHPDDLPAVMENFRLVLQGEVPPVGEYRMLTESGQYIAVETVPRSLIVDGEVVGTLGIARDLTPRKEMEETLQKVREELESKVERQMPRGNPYGFSFREFVVLHLVTAGQSDREIGITLGISSVTAQKHVEHLRAKMKAATRTEASVRALREGLLG